MQNIGILLGSFNPLHNGHLSIAKNVLQSTSLNIEEVWLTISPHNPLKSKEELINITQRVEIIERALSIEEEQRIKLCTIELQMTQPSYTIKTLETLTQRYPNKCFMPIIGSDCLKNMPQWKNFEKLRNSYTFLVYPRIVENPPCNAVLPLLHTLDFPIINISSTCIRHNIENGISTENMLPPNCSSLIYYAVGMQLLKQNKQSAAYNAILQAQQYCTDKRYAEALLFIEEVISTLKDVPDDL